MKGILFHRVRSALLCVWGGTLAACSSGTPLLAQQDDPTVERPLPLCGHARTAARRFHARQGWERQRAEYAAQVAAGLREPSEDTDLLHCDLHIEVLPDEYVNLAGSNTLTVQSKSDALTQFTFRLRSHFQITSAVINGTTPVDVDILGVTTRVVTLDRTYTMDEVFTLTIEYSGHAISLGYGSIEFDSHAGQDIVSTMSAPHFSFTWWPVKDGDLGDPGDNGDKFTLELALTAPAEMVVASNGVLKGVDPLSGDRKRHRWASEYPIAPYLVFFSATNYNTWSQDYLPLAGGAMPVLFYIYPEHDNPTNRAAWEKVLEMLYTYRDLFGEYPFVDEKYGIYEFGFGGGMEHQTFTGQGTFSEYITAHELSHQWWGDLITCQTWHDTWLNEGFATYTEALWAEFKPGSSGLPALKAKMATKKYLGGGTVYVTEDELGSFTDIYDGNTSYKKAAWVLHMLRHVLGSDTFFDMLRTYRAMYAFSGVTTQQFQEVCELFHPGGDLDWFFDEWVYGEYAPLYKWGWEHAQVQGRDYLLLHVDQAQSTSIQRFAMPVDIRVDGQTHAIFNDADPEHFVIPLEAPPASVEFDPDAWILWSNRVLIDYVPGPPKIVETGPAPGEVVQLVEGGTDTVSVTFHTDVSTGASHYSLVGAAGGPVAVSYAYDAGANTVTLTAADVLPPDDYTLAVSDALTAVDSGQQLDGEIADPLDPDSLPSGDGLAGGPATIEFAVVCALGDADCDADVDLDDFHHFQACFTGPTAGPPAPGCAMMRFDPDADIDLADFAAFSVAFDHP